MDRGPGMSSSTYRRGARSRRWFDGGPQRLWGLLTVGAALVAGLSLGRSLTRSEMTAEVAMLHAELSSRELEIDRLRQEAKQPPPQQQALDELTGKHNLLRVDWERLTARLTEADKAAAGQQRLIDATAAQIEDARRRCLEELEQFTQPVPVENVRRFAELMFDRRQQELQLIARQRQSPAGLTPDGPVGPDFGPQREPVPTLAESSSEHSLPETSTFFGPLPSRRAGYTYWCPDRSSRIAEGPRSRIVFSEPSGDFSGPVLR